MKKTRRQKPPGVTSLKFKPDLAYRDRQGTMSQWMRQVEGIAGAACVNLAATPPLENSRL